LLPVARSPAADRQLRKIVMSLGPPTGNRFVAVTRDRGQLTQPNVDSLAFASCVRSALLARQRFGVLGVMTTTHAAFDLR
jgi:hypothetical protein